MHGHTPGGMVREEVKERDFFNVRGLYKELLFGTFV